MPRHHKRRSETPGERGNSYNVSPNTHRDVTAVIVQVWQRVVVRTVTSSIQLGMYMYLATLSSPPWCTYRDVIHPAGHVSSHALVATLVYVP